MTRLSQSSRSLFFITIPFSFQNMIAFMVVHRRPISSSSSLAGLVGRMEEGRNGFKILTGKSKGKRPLERPMSRWENNVRMDRREMGVKREIGVIRLMIRIIVGRL